MTKINPVKMTQVHVRLLSNTHTFADFEQAIRWLKFRWLVVRASRKAEAVSDFILNEYPT